MSGILGDKFDIWTDGSFSTAKRVGGAGWVIKQSFKDPIEGKHPIDELHDDLVPYGSALAELTAFKKAMAHIPNGAKVHARMDAQNIIDWLKAKEIKGNPHAAEALKLTFSMAIYDIARMSSVEFTKVSGRNNEDMQRADELSKIAKNNATHLARIHR